MPTRAAVSVAGTLPISSTIATVMIVIMMMIPSIIPSMMIVAITSLLDAGCVLAVYVLPFAFRVGRVASVPPFLDNALQFLLVAF